MDGKVPAESLYVVAKLQMEIARAEASLDRKGRQVGLSWEAMALCLDISKQASRPQIRKEINLSREANAPRSGRLPTPPGLIWDL